MEIDITIEDITKVLRENANYELDDYVWALYHKNTKLEAENQEMRNTIYTLKEVINMLTKRSENKKE